MSHDTPHSTTDDAHDADRNSDLAGVPEDRLVDLTLTFTDPMLERMALEASGIERVDTWVRNLIHDELNRADRDTHRRVPVDVDVPEEIVTRAQLRAEDARLTGRDHTLEDYLHDYVSYVPTFRVDGEPVDDADDTTEEHDA